MKKSIYFILLFGLMLAFGCQKKKYPDPVEAKETSFYARLQVNGIPVEITAGKDRYYMYSSYAMDSSSIYNVIGELKQTSCTNCPNSLRIQINDSKASSPNSSIMIDSVLNPKMYSYLAGSIGIGYSIKFTGSFGNKPIADIRWDFGDGGTSSELNPTHTFQTGKHKITLTITSPDNNQSTITNTISVNRPNDLNGYVTGTIADSTISFKAYASGGFGPYKYAWDFGDSGTATGADAVHHYNIRGSYGVMVKISDSQLNTRICYYNTYTSTDASACAANFSYSGSTYIGKRLGMVSIQYTNADGVTFTSDNALQPATSNLEVISTEDFVKNENGQPVKKVKLKFNCVLYNGSQSITLQGLDVMAGFAYK